MDPFSEKILIIILSAAVGVGSTFITQRLLERSKLRKLANDFIGELVSLKSQVVIAHSGLTRTIQLLSKGIPDLGIPHKLTNPLFSNFYKDICGHLNEGQRQSYEFINGHVEAINKNIDRQYDITDEYARHPNDETLNWLFKIATGQYENILVLDWHILHHLGHQTDPALTLSSEYHRNYSEHLERIRSEVRQIVSDAKSLDATSNTARP